MKNTDHIVLCMKSNSCCKIAGFLDWFHCCRANDSNDLAMASVDMRLRYFVLQSEICIFKVHMSHLSCVLKTHSDMSDYITDSVTPDDVEDSS